MQVHILFSILKRRIFLIRLIFLHVLVLLSIGTNLSLFFIVNWDNLFTIKESPRGQSHTSVIDIFLGCFCVRKIN